MISKKTKYGLKAMTYIARNPDQMVPIAHIAEEENIPHKFLESILLLLKKSGFLGSKKGKGGGYYLRKDASEIYMTDLMRILEGPIAPVACVSLNYYEKCDDCADEKTCSLNKLMIQVRDANLNVFRNTTLEDLK
ncbi:Rrf2 family transcriptional regulator [Lutimonas saemankumensis]|uniref:RrF2 family transcriptional regulator n=1 Tax=Lutimonas saemankumensis TaxID=483016 RepID=UPI001CD1C9C7|nr:Rrf2 family transcriptional regulator [Lutimonas saemankumensis]MCA0933755.1 Rrf2 family transcriptional regulator [Lutimonas saemankumensis]